MAAVYTTLESLPGSAKGAVIAIGNFDGVHKGHQALIATARDIAQKNAAPLAVMTFEPHPREFFKPDGEPFRLTQLPLKRALLEKLGVDIIFAPAFDAAFSAQSAGEFITLIRDKLQAQHAVVGQNFLFGKGRTGNAAMLSEQMPATVIATQMTTNGAIYSSSGARAALQRGDFAAAAAILGWDWHIDAPVIHGDKRGRTLGMPTANQKTGRLLRIPYGIYAAEAQIAGEDVWRPAVTSFGLRPMFEVKEPLLETFIFDFDAEIYGQTLCIRPVRYLRGEEKFGSLDALTQQMKRDCQAARAALEL